MKKPRTQKQIEASRRNAQKSTGPKTPEGKTTSKMNAFKHGILSREAVVRGSQIKESSHEFKALHERLWQEMNPVGLLEEMLVDQIVTTHWRLRRVLKAESGEIALSVDTGHRSRSGREFRLTSMLWGMEGDPIFAMGESAFGNRFLENSLKKVRALVEQEGELTKAAVQTVIFHGKPFSLTEDLEKFRLELQQNPDGLDEPALRAKRKQEALAYLDRNLHSLSWSKSKCEEREKLEEEARQAATVLPSPEVLEKIMRYETMLKKDLHRDMIQLERLQRRRQGEAVPPPLTVEVNGDGRD